MAQMIAVDAADLLKNDAIDAMLLEHIQADPKCDEPSNENARRIVRELTIAWWMSEVWTGTACEEWQTTQ